MSLSVYSGSRFRCASRRSLISTFGDIARAAERLSASVGHRENDDEVINAIQLAFDLLTVLKRDRRRCRSRIVAAPAASSISGKP